MSNAFAIGWKEIRVYFGSPIAYIIMALFLVVTGVLFVNSLEGPFREASLRVFLAGDVQTGFLGNAVNATFFFLLLGPILTMRLFAEETKLGTIELLLTAPVHDYEVVLGKFFAGLVSIIVLLLLTLYYPLTFFIAQANPDIGPIIAGYFGLALLCALFVSVGLFASSLSNNQIVSVMLGLVIFFLFWFIGDAAQLVRGNAAAFLQFLSVRVHYTDFAKGIINTQDVVYFLALTAIFIFLTVRSLETRRWR